MQKSFMIASPRSGSGKTTVTLGLLRALVRRGLNVSSFKCGPDYIDPAFHQIATGNACYNLDSWTMSDDTLNHNFSRGAKEADVVIAEGSMGLFDGVAKVGASGDGASADISAKFSLPIVLVIDASGQSQSSGAVALGFASFRPDIKIAGVILGNIASDRHFALAKRGVEKAGIKVFGALPRGCVPPLPERHLGLVQAGETKNIEEIIDKLADAIEANIDIDAILQSSSLRAERSNPASLAALERDKDWIAASASPPRNDRVRKIALAKDIAFSFIYPHIMADWREQGIEILPFSPLANEAPDQSADLCWLAGGYPELHLPKLAGNKNFLNGLREFSAQKPIHGECGGYMVLGDAIIDADGKEWQMSGLLPLTTSFAKRKLHLGYRAIRLAVNSPIGKKGALVRGHEFHYSSIVKAGNAESIGELTDANGASLGRAGMKQGKVTGTFFHLVS